MIRCFRHSKMQQLHVTCTWPCMWPSHDLACDLHMTLHVTCTWPCMWHCMWPCMWPAHDLAYDLHKTLHVTLHVTYTSDLDNINSPSLWKHWHRIVHKLSNIILLQYPKENMSVIMWLMYYSLLHIMIKRVVLVGKTTFWQSILIIKDSHCRLLQSGDNADLKPGITNHFLRMCSSARWSHVYVKLIFPEHT